MYDVYTYVAALHPSGKIEAVLTVGKEKQAFLVGI